MIWLELFQMQMKAQRGQIELWVLHVHGWILGLTCMYVKCFFFSSLYYSIFQLSYFNRMVYITE